MAGDTHPIGQLPRVAWGAGTLIPKRSASGARESRYIRSSSSAHRRAIHERVKWCYTRAVIADSLDELGFAQRAVEAAAHQQFVVCA